MGYLQHFQCLGYRLAAVVWTVFTRSFYFSCSKQWSVVLMRVTVCSSLHVCLCLLFSWFSCCNSRHFWNLCFISAPDEVPWSPPCVTLRRLRHSEPSAEPKTKTWQWKTKKYKEKQKYEKKNEKIEITIEYTVEYNWIQLFKRQNMTERQRTVYERKWLQVTGVDLRQSPTHKVFLPLHFLFDSSIISQVTTWHLKLLFFCVDSDSC